MIKLKLNILVLLIFGISLSLLSQTNIDVNALTLAGKYYQEKEYEKAADLYLKIYESSMQPAYFNIFLNCLIELKDYDRAEKEIRNNMRGRSRRPEFLVQYGYILKFLNRPNEASEYYQKALEEVGQSRSDYISLSNEFLTRSEFELAEQVYAKAKQEKPDEYFHYELARIYMYQRNYNRMLDEYISLLKLDEKNLPNVQGSIQSALSQDVDGSLIDLFRNKLIVVLQGDPGRVVFSRLLIWYFIQEKRFSSALSQQIALDKRMGKEEENILGLADMAGRNLEYDEAMRAYDYLLSKGNQGPWYLRTINERMGLYYRRFISRGKHDLVQAKELAGEFEKCFSVLGKTAESYRLLINYAHLRAFYLNETDQAIALLNDGLKITGLNMIQHSEIKTEMADVQVYMGDEWEAVLLYSQIVEANKTNELGDEVKLKKAKLSYYLGDFKWAQAQLDVIKASTSKLTSNDAFELSIMIGNNLNLDTTDVPMKMFARADLLQFRNKDSLAVEILDSITQKYPSHSLSDDIAYRKAKIFQKQGKYQDAVTVLESILKKGSADLLADDILFLLAEIYQLNLNNTERASELYKQMLVEHPGSVYVVESRNRYRLLRGDTANTGTTSTNGEKP